MLNRKLIINLDKIRIPNTKIRKVLNIEKFNTDKFGKLYGVMYFINDIPIRLNSKDPNFNNIHSITCYNLRLEPEVYLGINEDITETEFLEFIKSIPEKVQKKIGKIKITENHTYFTEGWFQKTGNKIRGSDTYKKHEYKIDTAREFGSGFNKINDFVYKFTESMWNSLVFFWNIKSFFRWIKQSREIAELKTNFEDEMNQVLFSTQTGEEPEFIVYDRLTKHINLVVNNKSNAVMITGPPGTGKTYIVRRTLYFSGLKPEVDYVIKKGSVLDQISFFKMIYDNKEKIIVLDDFDSPLEDEKMINMLKSLTDSYERRRLFFPMTMKLTKHGRESYGIPEEFEFKGKLIIITNKNKKDIDLALLSRMPPHEIKFNTKEMTKIINDFYKYIFPNVDIEIKKEVFDYVSKLSNKKKIILDFRRFSDCIKTRLAYPEGGWEEFVKLIVGYK